MISGTPPRFPVDVVTCRVGRLAEPQQGVLRATVVPTRAAPGVMPPTGSFLIGFQLLRQSKDATRVPLSIPDGCEAVVMAGVAEEVADVAVKTV